MSKFDGPAPFTGALATPHSLATEAGTRVFSEGGTAIDAAIAAAAVLTVVYPHNVALGGDLIALVRSPDGAVTCVNASGWAARDVDVAQLRDRYGSSDFPTRGVDTVTVPGGVRGWQELRRMGSRLPFDRLLRDAEHAAEKGTPVSQSLAHHIDDAETVDPVGTSDYDRVFRPGGHPMCKGDLFCQPELATTLRTLRAEGPDAFYTGELAVRSVEFLRSRGSAFAAADFADYRAEVTAPLSIDVGGLTVLTSPPNTHGFMMLRALAALADRGVRDPLGADFGLLMRIFIRGNDLRSTLLADPRFGDIDVEALVHGEPGAPAAVGRTAAAAVPRGDTVGISAIDSDGYAVSLIQSVYHAFGSGLIDPETGILFHDRGTGFSLDPLSPNVIAPRKRPMHTLMPVIVTDGPDVRYVLSTMGGQGQPQILTQILLRAVAGASAAGAVSAPRGIAGLQVCYATPDTVVVEADLDPAARASLAAAGLPMIEMASRSEDLGQSNVVFAHADGGLTAASDPRSDGAAVVVQFARSERAAGLRS